jgi:periplasmic copper chaperone A
VMAQPGTARGSRARRVGAAGLTAAALVALTSCAAGQVAGSANQTSAIDGVAANVGSINLRAVAVVAPRDKSYPKGADAPLQLVLINSGMQSDTLTSVTSDIAAGAAFYPTGTDALSVLGTSSSATAGAPSPSSSAITLPVVPTLAGIEVVPGQRLSIGLADTDKAIVLHGLTRQLFPAESFKVTFAFQNAGSETFSVAVHLAPAPSDRPTENVSPTVQP